MATSSELNALTVKDLGAIAKELGIPGWHEMRKEELVRSLVQKSRTKAGKETIARHLMESPKMEKGAKSAGKDDAVKSSTAKGKSENRSKDKEKSSKSKPSRPVAQKTAPKASSDAASGRNPELKERQRLRRDVSTPDSAGRPDQLTLLVRDPFWLQATWELSIKTVERAKVALGHAWYTSVPVLRLFRQEADGTTYPKRHYVRDIAIHGGVNHWYLDVDNPPSSFLVELGYLTREKKFYSVASSNTVQTPQRQIVDAIDKLDGNWRGVAEDLGRIYKLSVGDGNNQELRRVLEEQLHRPMSAPLLSRAGKLGAGAERTRRNFHFDVDADVIIHGHTDPSVQVTIRNEPIKIEEDGSFSVRFSLPEKRHVFPLEAEGSDGVEMQRVILTVERNTRVLETLFHEPNEED